MDLILLTYSLRAKPNITLIVAASRPELESADSHYPI